MLRIEDIDFKTLRIMIHRLKGSHSGEHPLQPDEAKAIKGYLRERGGDSPILFTSNRGDPIARRTLDWNGANNFVFFARRGELVSNRTEDHELSMLALHLLQNCMVYINTLMMQQVLARPHWAGRLTPTDLRAVTPLIWEHVNPYGRFELDMETRLDLSPNGPW